MKKLKQISIIICLLLACNIVMSNTNRQAPKVDMTTQELRCKVGETATFEVQVSGIPEPKLKISHNGREIEEAERNKGRYSTTYKDGKMTFIIKGVVLSDAGEYTFRFENNYGMAEAVATLIVVKKPK